MKIEILNPRATMTISQAYTAIKRLREQETRRLVKAGGVMIRFITRPESGKGV